MEIQFRKIGNSKGAVIPALLLKELGLNVGDKADIKAENGRLIIEPKTKPQYTLDELLSRCDMNAPKPADLIDWEQAEAVGDELL
ncbi:AbrB/MazE/SpoVT family DNA-binding domain-containing protein [Idiomarina seosinensis]|uniref:AbrB/MazE/SpoVT family DNA-binding domain-containing protein n=1 Tax=Idiomarina seosinensis TaxID=281739 RepID=UPI00384B0669